MIGLGRAAEARSRLEALLREHPFEIETLLRLAELRASDGAGRDVAIDLARRAQRFGGDPAAQQLLDELGAEAAAAPSMDPGE
jgi:hypothetical protein